MSKTNYTLIHYLSNGSDSCRGCEMGRSSSDFDIFFFDNKEDIVDKYSELLVEEYFEEDVFGCHEYVVLINGVDCTNSYDEEQDETNPLFDRIVNEADKNAKILIAAKQLEREQATKIKAEKDKKLEKERIKREIAYLQSKL